MCTIQCSAGIFTKGTVESWRERERLNMLWFCRRVVSRTSCIIAYYQNFIEGCQEGVKLTFQSSATAAPFICGLGGESLPLNTCTHVFYLLVGTRKSRSALSSKPGAGSVENGYRSVCHMASITVPRKAATV
jgi:hypothetical protein